jgi:hypothetical protein
MRFCTVAALAAASLASSVALAKLPALSDEAKAKAGETAAKAAWTDKVAAFKLCQSMDHVASAYRASTAAAGKPASSAEATPPCADPGPYAPPQITPAASKPLETSGAHSPPGMAVSPPSNKPTSAEMTGPRK